jgi:hypothetical protein
LQWVQSGKTALRELRSYGLDNIWVCHMGQAVLDGSFAAFQEKILAIEMALEPAQAAFTSLRGDRLALGWEGALLVNDEAQETTGFKQYENPYCVVDLPAEEMEIIYHGEGLRLMFS